LNLFNAAMVTPTYYVYFTSATIVTSAILFQGFKGTAVQIVTVVMGFLQICAGVILLQLSKSAKDVPDTKVFTGDLDQVRTVAEQEEPEYEPRADTIRGGAAIIRSISKHRTEKQMQEIKRLQDESSLTTVNENEQVEWDGLRRRKTVLDPNQPSVRRQKPLHPPLGMSHFPDETQDSDNESDVHPGFFHFRHKRSANKTPSASESEPVPMSPIKREEEGRPRVNSDGLSESAEHVYGLPAGLRRPRDKDEDTSYKPQHQPSQHIHFKGDPVPEDRPSYSTLAPPQPPAHTAKRQFSFQNVFHRNRATSGSSDNRPTSKGALSFGSRKSANDPAQTEEERLGLVKGDSNNLLTLPEYNAPTPPEYSDVEEDWQAAAHGSRAVAPTPGALDSTMSHGRGPSAGTVSSSSTMNFVQPAPQRLGNFGFERSNTAETYDDDSPYDVMRNKDLDRKFDDYDDSWSSRSGGRGGAFI